MVTKRNVLGISMIMLIAVFVIINPLTFGLCKNIATWADGTKYCYGSFAVIDKLEGIIAFPVGAPSLALLLLSLITYWMKDEVFRVWWNFARWMVPIIILATVAIQFVPRNGGFFNMDSLIYLMVLAPLYTVLILVSLFKIFRTYRKLKKAA